MVHHGSLRGDSCRMRIGHIDRARSEHDVLCFRYQAGQENHRRRHSFRGISDMLTDIGLTKSELICQDHCFAVFLQSFRDVAAWRVQGHHERAVFQIVLLNRKKSMR